MRTCFQRPAWFGAAVLTLAAGVGAPDRVAGGEFRIQTRLYMGNEKEPASENITLFKDDVVYDYSASPQSTLEVTMFDPRRGRFVLLDIERRLRTQIPTKEVANHIQQLRAKMATQNENKMFQFFQNPQFKAAVDPETDELTFDSPYLTYRIVPLAVKDEQVLRTYIQFANWYAQLNSVIMPGSTPPFPRLAINSALQSRGVMPTRLTFTAKNLEPLAANKSITIRSVHEVEWKLFADDQRQIEETGRQLVTFQEVSPTEYLRLTSGQPEAQQAQRSAGKTK